MCHLDRLLLAESLALAGDPAASAAIAEVERVSPVEAGVLRAVQELTGGRAAAAGQQLLAAYQRAADDPWQYPALMRRSLRLANSIAVQDGSAGEALFHALGETWAVEGLWQARMATRVNLARVVDYSHLCVEALAPFEPHPMWRESFLNRRAECYRATAHPLAGRAEADLRRFSEIAGRGFWEAATSSR